MVENEKTLEHGQTGESKKARKQWRAPEMTIAPISATETGAYGGYDATASAAS